MHTFTIPTNLNGSQLRAELKAAGVKISDDINAVLVNENDLILDIAEKDIAKAESVVSDHVGSTTAPEPTIAEKLASAGLSFDELKAAILA